MKENVKNTIAALGKNGFSVNYFETGKEAAEMLIKVVEPGETVGFGGSMTLSELHISPALKEKGIAVYNHFEATSPEDRLEILSKAAGTDVYMCSSNAVTEDGRLVNIDGTGNRLSSMLFGHKRLYMVCGVNKLAGNYEEAMIRIKNQACGLNTKRLGRNTPCAETGKCANCNSPQRVCNATLVLDRKVGGIDAFNIFIVNEHLGY